MSPAFRRNLASLALVFAIFEAAPAPGADVLTYHNDNARTGLNPNESQLRPDNVIVGKFGPLFSRTVDGHVYAQPLYKAGVMVGGKAHNLVYVATQHDSVYAFDADDPSVRPNTPPIWYRSLLQPGETTVPSAKMQQGENDVQNYDIWPEIGIIGTPVIDPSTGTIYVVSKAKVLTRVPSYIQRLHALDLGTGEEKFGGPVTIGAIYPGRGNGFHDPANAGLKGDHDGTDSSGQPYVGFNPLSQNQRAGLLLNNGTVYVAWASHGDTNPYHGWLLGFDAAYPRKPPLVFNTTPDGGRGGIWQAGGAPAADAAGNIYFSTGNGTDDPDHGNFGDSVLKVARDGSNLKVVDFFTPTGQADQADPINSDLDLGSGGVVLLPPQGSGPADLLVLAGKEGTIYLVDRANMGRFRRGPMGGDAVVQALPKAVGEKFGMPAYFNGNLYYAGNGDPIKLFQLDQGKLKSSTIVSDRPFKQPAPTPSISAMGTANAIVWAIRAEGYQPSDPAILHAYDASTLKELYNSTQGGALSRDLPGAAVKFSVPTVADGRVFVGSQYRLTVFGLK